MSEKAKATAAPTTLKMGGKTFLMSPMNTEDHGIMDQWIQSRHVRMARGTLPEDASDKQRRMTEDSALAQAATLTFMSGAGILLMQNPEAMAMLFWCGIRRNHPEETPESIGDMITDPKKMRELRCEWDRINNVKVPRARTKSKKKTKRKTAKQSKRKNRRT